MKITDLRVWLTAIPIEGFGFRTWVFLEIDTDEGITGVGEASSTGGGGSVVIGSMLNNLRNTKVTTDFRESLIGEDPENIDKIWHKLWRRYTGGGGWSGFVTTMISGIDIALWDIKGKALGKPIYSLLGGAFRDKILLYTHVKAGDPDAAAAHARSLVAEGYTALKTDPYMPEMRKHHRQYTTGTISAEGAALGEDTMAAIREAVGPNIEVLLDAHGNFNVPTAIKLCRMMEPYDLTWFEEPVPPESLDALRQVRESVNIPLCTGERLYTRFGFYPVLNERLVDYIMPDIVWTGGISETRKIANLAEIFHIPVTPHDANGPINIIAGAHTMMTVPNFYRLELVSSWMDNYNACIEPHLDIRDGYLHLSDRPGLGVELNKDFLESHVDPDWQ
jgi:galactonate dehydratase